jgi:aryl-alcohol dehydrogenase-like predicted oxidoreductase
MNFYEPRILGCTGLKVGRLGMGSSYGAPAAGFEEAFECGCNYFYWGALRRGGMAQAIRNLCGRGQREKLVIVIQSFARLPSLIETFCGRALRTLGLEAADVLLLGWHNRQPSERILECAQALKDQGMFRFLGLSSHNRKLFSELAQEGVFDIFHVRYNAVHRGAEAEVFSAFQKQAPEVRPGLVAFTATRWGQLLKQKNMPPGETALTAADCYRFVLSHPVVDVCLAGPRNQAQMQEALRTLDLGPLQAQDMARLKRVGDYLKG